MQLLLGVLLGTLLCYMLICAGPSSVLLHSAGSQGALLYYTQPWAACGARARGRYLFRFTIRLRCTEPALCSRRARYRDVPRAAVRFCLLCLHSCAWQPGSVRCIRCHACAVALAMIISRCFALLFAAVSCAWTAPSCWLAGSLPGLALYCCCPC